MKFSYLLSILILSIQVLHAQIAEPCYKDQVVTSSYATAGSGLYKNEIIWLTWGGKDENNPYGKPNQELETGTKSYASILLGEGKYLCLEAEIIKIDKAIIESYRPGDYPGDSMDDWYNIGGNNSNNKLICGIINKTQGAQTHFKIRIKSSINGTPIRLRGLVVADAESTDPFEYIRCKADGTWSIIDVKKNITQGPYIIRKDPKEKIIQFGTGNDISTAAIAALKFNSTAFKVGSYESEIEISTKGSGKQAVAIGVLTPGIDLGDAPESYGDPLHTIEKLNLSVDNSNYTNVFSGNLYSGSWTYRDRQTNININNYNPARIIPNGPYYLGTTHPGTNTHPVHSILANLDGLDNNLPLEEDAWPETKKRVSYNSPGFTIGSSLQIQIPYTASNEGYITAWIDFDGDGYFANNQQENVSTDSSGNIILTSSNHFEFTAIKVKPNVNGVATLNWTIPKKMKYNNTYVRLRIGERLDEISSPISNAIEGEVEDHRIIILTPGSTNPNIQNTLKK